MHKMAGPRQPRAQLDMIRGRQDAKVLGQTLHLRESPYPEPWAAHQWSGGDAIWEEGEAASSMRQSVGRGGLPRPSDGGQSPALCLFLLPRSDFPPGTLCSELRHSGPDSHTMPRGPRLACVYTAFSEKAGLLCAASRGTRRRLQEMEISTPIYKLPIRSSLSGAGPMQLEGRLKVSLASFFAFH